MLLRTLLGAATMLLVGCAAVPDQPPPSPDSPASPSAAEAPIPARSQALALTSATLPDVRTTSPTTTPAVYTCEMHPEVLSNQPGKCPKCGMKLVPTRSAMQPQHRGHGGHP